MARVLDSVLRFQLVVERFLLGIPTVAAGVAGDCDSVLTQHGGGK